MLHSTVANIIRRRNSNSNNESRERRLRKPKRTPRCICSLIKCTKENRFQSLRVITAEFNEFRFVPVSLYTVCKVVKRNGIENYIAVFKPSRTLDHETRRMKWAVHHQSWSDEQ